MKRRKSKCGGLRCYRISLLCKWKKNIWASVYMCRIRKYHIGRNWECVKTIPTETSIFQGNVISADRLCISLQSRRWFEVKLAMNSFLCRLSPAGIEIFLEIQLVSRIVSALISTRGSSRATISGFLYLSYCILVDLTHFKISEVLIFFVVRKSLSQIKKNTELTAIWRLGWSSWQQQSIGPHFPRFTAKITAEI